MAKRRKSVIPGMSFSWKRAVGISSAKQKFARKTGIPTTRSGMQRKAGRMMGCLIPLSILCIIIIFVSIVSIAFADDMNHQYAQIVTKQGPLNMRRTASSKADIIDKIPKDTILEVIIVDDTWCSCTYNGSEGYIMTKYLSFMDLSQFRVLSLGDSGQDVLALKEKLRELYFIDEGAEFTDRYDSDTEIAVRLFQAAHNVEETGIVSPEQQAFLTWGSPKNNLPTQIMNLTISSKCSGFNHVGENWSRYYAIDGQSISSGDMVEIVLGQSITIYSKVTERDSSPDVGSAKEEIEITQDYFDNGFTITQTVSVREDKGRYSGNKAVWTITYSFKP